MRGKAIFLFVLLLLLVIPAMAQTVTQTPPTDQVIWSVSMVADPQSTGTIVATLSSGEEISGSWSYTGWPNTVTEVTLAGDTRSSNYIITGLYSPLYMKLWNADNQTSGVRKLKLGYGQINGFWNDYAEADIPKLPITRFYLSSEQDVKITYEYKDQTAAMKQLTSIREQSILDFIVEAFWDALTFLEDLIYWVRFFFTAENLMLIIALFLAVPLAFAAKNSRGNMQRFLREYFKTLKGLIDFLFSVWRMLLESIGTVRGWFRI